MREEEIGGALVCRPFQRGKAWLKGGDELSGDEVRAIPIANRRALIDSHFLELFPVPSHFVPPAPPPGDRFIVRRAHDSYDVIEGRRLNDEPLTEKAAMALADQK